MTSSPIICFGQQPCGFFPRRFLFAKIQTARRLQDEIGGEIVFFCHDSDHDPRETRTILRHRSSGIPLHLNFAFANQIQRKYSPLYLKRVLPAWQAKTGDSFAIASSHVGCRRSRRWRPPMSPIFVWKCTAVWGCWKASACCARAIRSFACAACEIPDFFVDVPYEGEIVRARLDGDVLKLHEGGDFYTDAAGDALHQGTNQPRPRHASALDAIGGALHALCRRRE